ncbi:hypothetical protein [Aureliella helgolandensis]|uniref:Uncharacterized protein n=1 Tax=Aureliella helgolandensis TaxID=2527968 RepID=A0A518GEI9_9BACT|nr:hypothetical protein [Aureliella helgolandensis]QDV26968.1 hypothetical protein Q31a_53480 [Aureliella helgolandensis]
MTRIRLSLASIFWLTATVALAIALIYSRVEISQLTRELRNVVPLREMEIAAQIERQTSAVKLPVSITSTMYSGNTYLIEFEYFDPLTGTRTPSSFKLRYEQNGRHVGAIRDDPFLSPQPDEGGERGLRITVIDPLFAELANEYDAKTQALTK